MYFKTISLVCMKSMTNSEEMSEKVFIEYHHKNCVGKKQTYRRCHVKV